MQPEIADDTDLVRETLEGNQLSFQLLVERYQGRVFGLVRHYTRNAAEVEDIAQDTFLKAFSRLDTFQHQSSFSTWLCRIAVNTALDSLKRKGRSPVRVVEEPDLVEAAQTGSMGRGSRILSPAARLEAQEISEITQTILADMPEIFRTVLVLREFEDRAYQEMADLLGISIGTVESRLFRARARFRDALVRDYPEYAHSDLG